MAGVRLTQVEIDERIRKAYELRYNLDDPMTQARYVEWASEEYGDKSQQQYCQYFSNSRHIYEEGWKNKLQRLLEPAINELESLLQDDDPKIRQRAIDQIVKFTGNDVEKVEATIDQSIVVSWGNEESSQEEEY